MESAERKIGVAEAAESLGLGKSAFYERMKFLGITPHKEGRQSFLSPKDIELLNQLGDHIDATGTMEGFGAITLRNEEQAIANSTEDIGTGDRAQQYAGIIRSAKEHRAGIEMAKYAIASRLNVEDLDPDLIEEIDQVRAATLPKSVSASATAGAVLNQFLEGRI